MTTSPRLAQLQKLFTADPMDAFCAYGIGLEYSKSGDFPQAISWLDKALEIDAHYCYAYYQKAKALSQAGEDDQARAVLKTGITAANDAGDGHAAQEMAELLASIEA